MFRNFGKWSYNIEPMSLSNQRYRNVCFLRNSYSYWHTKGNVCMFYHQNSITVSLKISPESFIKIQWESSVRIHSLVGSFWLFCVFVRYIFFGFIILLVIIPHESNVSTYSRGLTWNCTDVWDSQKSVKYNRTAPISFVVWYCRMDKNL